LVCEGNESKLLYFDVRTVKEEGSTDGIVGSGTFCGGSVGGLVDGDVGDPIDAAESEVFNGVGASFCCISGCVVGGDVVEVLVCSSFDSGGEDAVDIVGDGVCGDLGLIVGDAVAAAAPRFLSTLFGIDIGAGVMDGILVLFLISICSGGDTMGLVPKCKKVNATVTHTSS
jgi:hypothetical protein